MSAPSDRQRTATSVDSLDFSLRRNLVPIALVFLMLGASFAAGIRSGLRDTTSHVFIGLSAMTAVLSSEYHGLSGHPYQGYLSIRTALEQNGMQVNKENFPENFRNYANLMKALRTAASTSTCGSPLVSDTYNDQGVFDFYRGSFALFGTDVRSTYYFYFLIIATSSLIYLACFWREYAACALLFACATAIYSFMPSYVLNNNQLISVSNTRFLSTLGIIPLLHLLMTFGKQRGPFISWISLTGVVAQSMIMELAISARSTAQWMEIAFAIAVVALLLRVAYHQYPLWKSAEIWSFLVGRGAVVFYVVATLIALGSLRALSLPPSCGTAINQHPFWHNMFIGLSFDPAWTTRIEPEIGLNSELALDDLAFKAAALYVERHHLPYQTKPSIWIETRETLANGNDPVPFGSWRIYEKIVRKAFFEFIREHPVYTLKVFFIDKPQLLAHHLRGFFIEIMQDLTLLDVVVFTIMIVSIGILGKPTRVKTEYPSRQVGRLLLLAAFCCLVSAIPLIVVYPRNFLIADQAYLMVAVGVLCLIWMIAEGRTLILRWWPS
jgi:hypothetical protein